MIKSVLAACCIKEILRNAAVGRCCVVWKDVNNDSNSILICHITHVLELISCAQLIVSNYPVSWLIMVPPHTIRAVKVHAWIGIKTFVYRRCLDCCIASICYVCHVVCYSIKAPAEGMKNCAVLDVVAGNKAVIRFLLLSWSKCSN